jgi:hypothetical protein
MKKVRDQNGNGYLRVCGKFYRPWAKKSPNPGFIVCRWCMTEISIGNVTGEKGHENSISHKKNKEKYEKDLEKTKEIHERESNMLTKAQKSYRSLRIFEYKLLNFCLGTSILYIIFLSSGTFPKNLNHIVHNMSFLNIEHISDYLRKEAANNENIFKILPNITLHRQKAEELTTKVMKENYRCHLSRILESKLFSISADEVTDISGYHYLAICVIFGINLL